MTANQSGRELLERARRAHYGERDVARARLDYEAALAALDAAGDDAGAAEALAELANLRVEQGWMGDATALVRDAEQRAERAGLTAMSALLESTRGEIALRSGDCDGAVRAFARALRDAERGGEHVGRVLMMSARAAQDAGELDEATLRLERAVAELTRIGDGRRALIASIRLALVAIEAGRLDAALAQLDAARAAMDPATDPLVVREAWLYTAAAHALAGRLADADHAVARAREFRGTGTSTRHARHIVEIFDALIAAARARAMGGADPDRFAPARAGLAAAEEPGADGGSAVNCFYVIRAGARLVRRVLPGDQCPIGRTRVARDGSWFQLADGRTVLLGHRPTLARVLAGLVAAQGRPGGFATTEDLLAAGWPDQRPVGTSGVLRVYASVSRLRRLGLADLAAVEGGYRLAVDVA